MELEPTAFITSLPLFSRHASKSCRFCSRTSPAKPVTYRRRRPYPRAIFLPPEGAPIIPDDDSSDEEEIRLRDKSSTSSTSGDSLTSSTAGVTLERVGSVSEGLDTYDTWERGKKRRSISTIRGRSELQLGAEELNESLGAKGVDRLRLVLAPDEAFGALFSWNAVVYNARELELECWRKLAEEEGLLEPDLDDIVRAEGMAPEAAVQRVFFWGGDWGTIKRWCFKKNEIRKDLEKTFEYKLCPGIKTWVANLEKYGVNYVICSPLPRLDMERILKDLELKQTFTKLLLVSNEDEFDTLEQMYLLASMKAGRPPGKCVIFTDRPAEITAGHETSAKVVGLIGAHPAYEIKSADLSVRDYDELVVYNIRRLFSEINSEFMDPLTELEQN